MKFWMWTLYCQMKNSLDWINSWLNIAEEKFHEVSYPKWNTASTNNKKEKKIASESYGTTSDGLVYVEYAHNWHLHKEGGK